MTRRQKLTQWFREDFKSNFCCIVCGEKHIDVLDFHHWPEKGLEKDMLTTGLRNKRSRAWFIAEADKCVVLCANHHRLAHAGVIKIEDYL